jgi:hypothetical protein
MYAKLDLRSGSVFSCQLWATASVLYFPIYSQKTIRTKRPRQPISLGYTLR